MPTIKEKNTIIIYEKILYKDTETILSVETLKIYAVKKGPKKISIILPIVLIATSNFVLLDILITNLS